LTALEVNIDALVGPTHNYAGLSFGNVASQKHALTVSNPKQAALQGLRKMKFLHDLGIPQIVMPPHPRPAMGVLKQLGFSNIKNVPQTLLYQGYSASAMWAANAATISPSADTKDGKVHITPANLVSKFHRSLEALTTAHYLKQMFPGPHFVHHDPLPAHLTFADEGAANHMRLSKHHANKGTEIFVYGGATKKYPARQSMQACEAIARLHGLDLKRAVFLEQHPDAIDAGVFHNDVIAMSNERLLIYHEKAFKRLDRRLQDHFTLIKITERQLTLRAAVATYFFNSQLVTLPDGKMAVIAPKECEEHARARSCFEFLMAEGHVNTVYYLDVRESMKNGGGPACLRLRMVLTETERQAVHSCIWLDEELYDVLYRWIEKNYRDRMTPSDLYDPLLVRESYQALAALAEITKMNLGAA